MHSLLTYLSDDVKDAGLAQKQMAKVEKKLLKMPGYSHSRLVQHHFAREQTYMVLTFWDSRDVANANKGEVGKILRVKKN